MLIENLAILLEVAIMYLSIATAVFAFNFYRKNRGMITRGGKLIVFGMLVFSAASFFRYLKLFENFRVPLVVELLVLAFVCFMLAGFMLEARGSEILK